VNGRGFRSVVLDCDSTLVTVEGIDLLAEGHEERVAALTRQAMEGIRPLEEVYGERLALAAPSRDAVERLGERYVDALVEDAADVLEALRWLEKEVRVVSGGLRPPVERLARAVGLGADAVAAVDIRFAADGSYAGFDESSPLVRGDGKAEVIRGWRLPRPSLLVGDGASDLAARPAVDAFVAYAGVVRRESVVAGADHLIGSRSLAPLLVIATSLDERVRLRRDGRGELLARGEALLGEAVG